MALIDCPVFMTTCPKIMKLGDLRHKTLQDSKYGIQFADRAMPDCEPISLLWKLCFDLTLPALIAGNQGSKATSSVLTSFSSYATK